jgi:hypothetical protein
LHVVLEGISRGFSAVNIRKFVLRAGRLGQLVELGSLTPSAAAFLEASVRAGLNILVAGGTHTGKTTMLNCLAAAIPGGDRVVSAEPDRRGGGAGRGVPRPAARPQRRVAGDVHDPRQQRLATRGEDVRAAIAARRSYPTAATRLIRNLMAGVH